MSTMNHVLPHAPVHPAESTWTTPGRLWLLLVGGFVLLVLSNGRFAVPIAAWVAPVVLLRFVRQAPLWRGFLSLYGLAFVAFVVAWFGWIPVPHSAFVGMAGGLALLQISPYLLDRVTYRRLPRRAAALVLPTSMVAVNYGITLASPYGSWGDIAYAQAGNLPLTQILAVVGMHGVTFLVYWVAASLVDAWTTGPTWRGVGIPAAVLLAVLLLGGLRVGLRDQHVPTARIAAVVIDHGELFAGLAQHGFDLTNSAATPPAVVQYLRPHHQQLLTLTAQEAQAGAAMIVWAEASAVVRQPEEAALIAEVAAIALQHETYVVLGLITYQPGMGDAANKLVTVGPDGQVVATYRKTKIVPGDQNVPGDGTITMLDTPFGRIAHVICFDLDFPAFARQASHAGADIIVAPSNDWPEIARYHGEMAAYRGIENGAAVVRPAGNGRSLAVDAYGRSLAEAQAGATVPHVMVSNVPTAGVATAYRWIGDGWAWGCGLAVVGLGVGAWRRRGARSMG